MLSIIDKNYISDPMPSEPIKDIMNKYKVEWATIFFPRVKNQIQDDILIRISRSGLYQQNDSITGDNGDGTLIPLFYRIKELIQFE